jgi:hypothetical protein
MNAAPAGLDNGAQPVEHLPQRVLPLRGSFGHQAQIWRDERPLVGADSAQVRLVVGRTVLRGLACGVAHTILVPFSYTMTPPRD